MIPLRDNIATRTTPYVNYAVIALCAVAFVVQLAQASLGVDLVEGFGMIPARVLGTQDEIVQRIDLGWRGLVMHVIGPAAVPELLTLLTCTFLHGSWLHLIGNMWMLWIFGDNVEDRLGHVRYAVFYLASGVIASVVHLASGPDSTLPTIGASGAVAGVMGAYFILYPRAKVMTLIWLFVIVDIWVLPAPIFLGAWFGMQLLQGTFSLGATQSGGVAWWAHIGGFVAGMAVAFWLRRSDGPRSPVVEPPPRSARPLEVYMRRRQR